MEGAVALQILPRPEQLAETFGKISGLTPSSIIASAALTVATGSVQLPPLMMKIVISATAILPVLYPATHHSIGVLYHQVLSFMDLPAQFLKESVHALQVPCLDPERDPLGLL